MEVKDITVLWQYLNFVSLKLKDILKAMVNDYWLQIFIQMQNRIALGFLFL